MAEYGYTGNKDTQTVLTLHFAKVAFYKYYTYYQSSISAIHGCRKATIIKTDSLSAIRKISICGKSDRYLFITSALLRLYYNIFEPDIMSAIRTIKL